LIQEQNSLLQNKLSTNQMFKKRYQHVQKCVMIDRENYLRIHRDIAEKAYKKGLFSKLPTCVSSFWNTYKNDLLKKNKIFYPELYSPLLTIQYDSGTRTKLQGEKRRKFMNPDGAAPNLCLAEVIACSGNVPQVDIKKKLTELELKISSLESGMYKASTDPRTKRVMQNIPMITQDDNAEYISKTCEFPVCMTLETLKTLMINFKVKSETFGRGRGKMVIREIGLYQL